MTHYQKLEILESEQKRHANGENTLGGGKKGSCIESPRSRLRLSAVGTVCSGSGGACATNTVFLSRATETC